MQKEIIETDVLCVGGGIAGLMAAIRASEAGAKVTVAEKGNTLRSGAGAVGCDHFVCYIPEVHGSDVAPVIEEKRLGQLGAKLKDTEVARIWFEKSFDIVKLWDSWGIPMKYEGRYEFAGHSFPGSRYQAGLKYAGQMQKPILTREALKRGVTIINRVMVFELLADVAIAGAIGACTREDKLIEFRAKSVILGTGTIRRLYPGPTPAWMFNNRRPATLAGDGRAMAYRCGADLVNMEMFDRHAGPRYFSRSGQGTWIGVVRDALDKPVGPFVTQPDKRYGDMIIEVNKNLFAEYARSGMGPVYMDCRGISDKDLEYFMYWMKHEGNVALLNHLEEEGIDLRNNPIEFMTYEPECAGTISCNPKTEASVNGLYAAGDETGTGISLAAVFGWIAGENAARYAQKKRAIDTGKVKTKIEEKINLLGEFRRREQGPDWKEVNIALQQIMSDYAGQPRSETLLEAGFSHLQRLKTKAYTATTAKNPHELMRVLEVLNLRDLGEAVFAAAIERRETRGRHVRVDYPFTNPLMDKPLIARAIGNKPVVEWQAGS